MAALGLTVKEGELPKLSLSPNGKQFLVSSHKGASFSLGAFEFKGDATRVHPGIVTAHEGGHSKQSAVLGPLYLPYIAQDYARNGGMGKQAEEWAESWSAK